MPRPAFIMVEPEPPESISARKLVLEVSKFNVITAYTGQEATELLHAHPTVSAIIIHSDIHDIPCQVLAKRAKEVNPNLPVILLATHLGLHCEGIDERVPSQSPEDLLLLLREMFGDPRPPDYRPVLAR